MDTTLKETISSLPNTPGVYIFRDSEKNPLYVGKSIGIQARVRSYFHDDISLPPKTKKLVSEIANIEIIETESEIEALLLEAALIQSIKPNYNRALKDDKRYKFIQVTETFYKRTDTNVNVRTNGTKRKIYHPDHSYPTITTSRKTNDAQSVYFGPFPDATTVRKVLKMLRKTFGWCKYTTVEEVRKASRPCFYYHIGQCPGFCAGDISHSDYIEHIDTIVQFLRGNKKELIIALKQKMTDASSNENFEMAAQIRDQLERIEYITQSFRLPNTYFKDPTLETEQFYFARQQLRDAIGAVRTDWAPWLRNLDRVEAYDISNTQGTEPTGSMVVLIQGEKKTDLYRMFKIRAVEGINDPAMIGEVLQRRLKYLVNKRATDASFSQIPQLLVIDGGKTQVNSAQKELEHTRLDIPVVGLAKREEELIVPLKDGQKFETIVLPKDSPALHLMQKVRDEAHRFAKNYHVKLRSKAVNN